MTEQITTLKVAKAAITSLAVDTGKRYCALGLTDGCLCIYSFPAVLAHQLVSEGVLDSQQAVRCLRWGNGPSGDWLAAGKEDGYLSISTQSRIGWRDALALQLHQGDILDLAWAGEQLVTASVDNSIAVLVVRALNGVMQAAIVQVVDTQLGWVTGLTYFQGRLFVQVLSL
jgi:WD40 repeat protein